MGDADRPAVGVAATDGLDPSEEVDGSRSGYFKRACRFACRGSRLLGGRCRGNRRREPQRVGGGTDSLGVLVGVRCVGCWDTYRRPVRILGERGDGRV